MTCYFIARVRDVNRWTLSCSFLCIGLMLGSILAPYVLSTFDGTRLYADLRGSEVGKIRRLETPTGFVVSPLAADILHTCAVRGMGRVGEMSSTSYIYIDKDSYYMVSVFTELLPRSSNSARILGTRVNGRTGRVYNSGYRSWEKMGYLPLTLTDVKKLLPIGTHQIDARIEIGKPLEEYIDDDVRMYVILTLDGPVALDFDEGTLSNIRLDGRHYVSGGDRGYPLGLVRDRPRK